MGKKGQKGVHHPSHKHHKYKADKRKQKRRHPRLYWIQDCPDLQPSPEEAEDHPDKNGIHIKLTEIHLMDDLHGATTDFTANAPTVDPNSDSTLVQTPETGNETVAMSIHMDHDNEETKAPKTTANDSHHEENHEENQHQNNIKEESLELATQQVDRVNDNDRRDHPSLNNENVRSSLVPRTTQVYIQRIPSNQKSLKKIKSSNYVEFPNGNNGDGICNPYHPDLVPHKYWAQRKRLFHRFDQGIRMGTTEQEIGEAFFSVTPQCIAQHIAQRMVQQHYNNNNHNMTNDCTASNDTTIHPPSLVIIDAFVGVGGNAIALALQNPHVMVLCIDVDVQKLYCTAHNASRVYHIPSHQLLLLHFDACRILSQYYRNGTKLKPHDHDDSMPFSFTNRHHNCPTIIDREKLCGYNMITTFDELPNNIHGIFLSPPWGGVNYEDVGPRHYHIESNIELRSFVPTSTTTDTHRRNENETTVVNGEDLLQYAVQALPMNQWNIAYFLPRNLNGIMFGQSCGRILGMVHRSDDDDSNPPRPRYLHIELEQNIVNTKLKTVTAYIQSHKFVT